MGIGGQQALVASGAREHLCVCASFTFPCCPPPPPPPPPPPSPPSPSTLPLLAKPDRQPPPSQLSFSLESLSISPSIIWSPYTIFLISKVCFVKACPIYKEPLSQVDAYGAELIYLRLPLNILTFDNTAWLGKGWKLEKFF